MMEGKQQGSSPKAAGGKVHKKNRKGPKPKMSKEERREKYTAIARKQRDKHLTKRRDKHIVCYRCRQKGHSAENCTNEEKKGAAGNKQKQSKNICYKCGSTEHRIQLCPKLKSFNLKTGTRIDFGKLGELPYANCYVCNKNGHLAGNCPDGKGLYPQGGSCRICGSVNHLAQHCPSKNEKKEQVSDEESVTIEQYLDEPTTSKDESKTETKLKKKRKVVTF